VERKESGKTTFSKPSISQKRKNKRRPRFQIQGSRGTQKPTKKSPAEKGESRRRKKSGVADSNKVQTVREKCGMKELEGPSRWVTTKEAARGFLLEKKGFAQFKKQEKKKRGDIRRVIPCRRKRKGG